MASLRQHKKPRGWLRLDARAAQFQVFGDTWITRAVITSSLCWNVLLKTECEWLCRFSNILLITAARAFINNVTPRSRQNVLVHSAKHLLCSENHSWNYNWACPGDRVTDFLRETIADRIDPWQPYHHMLLRFTSFSTCLSSIRFQQAGRDGVNHATRITILQKGGPQKVKLFLERSFRADVVCSCN